VAILHHTTKGGEGPLLIRLRGTGDLGAVLRFAIGVEKKSEALSMIETDGNLPGGAEPFGVEFHDGLSVGGKKLIRLTPRTSTELKQVGGASKLATAKVRVMEALRFGGLSLRALRKEVGGRAAIVDTAIDELIKEGRIYRDPASGLLGFRSDAGASS
jgi:hypothetical protein